MERDSGAGEQFPGDARHRAILRAVVAHYAGDPRVRAVAVFGSLGRGNWDRYSDVDLDVVIADSVRLSAVEEATRLCDSFAAIGERAALVIPDRDDAADIVLRSLMELSVRYHPLGATSPNITDSLVVLAGSLDAAAIIAAGEANRAAGGPPLTALLDRCVRHAVGVDIALRRGQPWAAVEQLHAMRGLLMQLFARTHGGVRPQQAFQSQAPAALHGKLAATVSGADLPALQAAFTAMLDLLENDVPAFTNEQLALTEAHREVLRRVRSRNDVGEPTTHL